MYIKDFTGNIVASSTFLLIFIVSQWVNARVKGGEIIHWWWKENIIFLKYHIY